MATQDPPKRKRGGFRKGNKHGVLPWAKTKFTLPKEKPAVPLPCAECGKVTIPLAMHPAKRSIKFCTPACGKKYLTKHPSGKSPRNDR